MRSRGEKRRKNGRFVIFIIQWMRQLIWVEYKSIQWTCICLEGNDCICVYMREFFPCCCFHADMHEKNMIPLRKKISRQIQCIKSVTEKVNLCSRWNVNTPNVSSLNIFIINVLSINRNDCINIFHLFHLNKNKQ